MTTPNLPFVNQGLLYVNGLSVSAGTINVDGLTTADIVIGTGQCRDSTNTNDIVLSDPEYTLQSTVVGANGLDTGTMAIDKLYAIHVIGDSTRSQPGATLLSLSGTNPTLPGQYDMFRRVGWALTAHAAARFVYFHQRGNGSVRDMWYTYNTLVLNGGTSATLAAINLRALATGTAPLVPVTASKAFVFAALTATAAAKNAIFSASADVTIAAGGVIAANPGTGEVIISAAADTTTNSSLTVPISVGAAPIMQTFYAVTAAGNAALSVSVQGYQDLL